MEANNLMPDHSGMFRPDSESPSAKNSGLNRSTPSGNPSPFRTGDGRKALGQWGEDQAAAYLEALGYRILERNWRKRSGEIDIIASDEDTLVFVEVRTRRPSARFGSPEESVDARKQRQVRETAQLYLHTTRQFGHRCRFDVIAVTAASRQELQPHIRHISNAF